MMPPGRTSTSECLKASCQRGKQAKSRPFLETATPVAWRPANSATTSSRESVPAGAAGLAGGAAGAAGAAGGLGVVGLAGAGGGEGGVFAGAGSVSDGFFACARHGAPLKRAHINTNPALRTRLIGGSPAAFDEL